MRNLTRIKRVLAQPSLLLIFVLNKTARLFPDKLFLELKYRLVMGQKLDLKNPKTFNEKLQWLKLYNRKPEYTTMVDKYAVKKYVADKIGEEYIIPTLGVWDKPEDIDWDALPNQFVLKTTHYGGGNGIVICKDKSKLNKEKTIKCLRKALKGDLYRTWREWPYKNVPKRVIAEKYICVEDEDLPDYKVYTFNGKPKVILVCRNRFKNEPMIEDYYSDKWEFLDIKCPGHPNSMVPIEKPKVLEKMLEFSEVLSKDIPHLRVDFYIVNDNIYFGELTFFVASGMDRYEPACWDEIFGSWLNIR